MGYQCVVYCVYSWQYLHLTLQLWIRDICLNTADMNRIDIARMMRINDDANVPDYARKEFNEGNPAILATLIMHQGRVKDNYWATTYALAVTETDRESETDPDRREQIDKELHALKEEQARLYNWMRVLVTALGVKGEHLKKFAPPSEQI